ncbi:hypothetical protein EZY14_013690 [Kordia sp. TARA_039_SRF]|nr:hypothetical protein EZY14_013690 [Kordia sp. TARA_039_SRF]
MNDKIEFCKTCTNRAFSSSQGIVCGLTNEKPAFLLKCDDFVKDVKHEKRMADRQAAMEEDDIYDENGKRVPTWRVVLSIIIFILVLLRLIMRLSD